MPLSSSSSSSSTPPPLLLLLLHYSSSSSSSHILLLFFPPPSDHCLSVRLLPIPELRRQSNLMERLGTIRQGIDSLRLARTRVTSMFAYFLCFPRAHQLRRADSGELKERSEEEEECLEHHVRSQVWQEGKTTFYLCCRSGWRRIPA